jgi:hypothetical protein
MKDTSHLLETIALTTVNSLFSNKKASPNFMDHKKPNLDLAFYL